MGRDASIVAAALGLLAVAVASPAAAQDERRLRWSDDWARVHPAAYAAAGAALGGTIVFDHLYELGPTPRWRGPALFDTAARVRLRGRTEEVREEADRISDVLLVVLLGWPAFDALGVAGVGDRNSDVAWQLTMIALEAVVADYVLRNVLKLLLDRERPFAPRCTPRERRLGLRECGRRGRGRGFYSAHSSAAFSSAGIVCLSHAYLPLYGNPAADGFACGLAMLTAATVGLLRIVADRHYATDVVAGALVGLATGVLLPWALHYGRDPTPERSVSAPLRAPPPLVGWGGTF